MRVLVACEFSGVVRDAFSARGHDAWSCDLLPSERNGQHVQGDVALLLEQEWDLLIGHPPCTYLCNSGVRWLSQDGRTEATKESLWKSEREKLMEAGCDLFAALYWSKARRVGA